MKSLEKKSEPMMDMPMMSMFPRLCVDNEQMPEIDSWEVGKTYKLMVEVKMTSYEKEVDIKKGESSDADFDIMSYKVA